MFTLLPIEAVNDATTPKVSVLANHYQMVTIEKWYVVTAPLLIGSRFGSRYDKIRGSG